MNEQVEQVYQLIALPCLSDNYIWLLRNATHAWVVDPSQAEPVRDYIAQHRLILADVLITHHHHDHVGGIAGLMPDLKGEVIGDSERIDGLTRRIDAPCDFWLSFSEIEVRALSTPGHTHDHISYYCPYLLQTGVLFCGDTLFSAGCGRVFDGTMTQLRDSLLQLMRLPDEILIACAHEYTLANLAFALVIEEGHYATQTHLNQVQYARARGLPSLPSSLGLEKTINPFLRALSHPPLDWRQGLLRLAENMGESAATLPNVDDVADGLAWLTLCRALKNRF